MPLMRIPGPVRRGLLNVLQLKDSTFEAFLSAINNVPMSLMDKDLPEQLSTEIGASDLPPAICAQILTGMSSLYRFRSEEERSVEGLVASIMISLEPVSADNTNESELVEKIKSGSDDKMKDRLLRLLDVKPFEHWTKADKILHEHARVYHNAHILTDIRPVFDEAAEELVGAVIVHTLKIQHGETGEIRDFFVALDTQDIGNLRDTLDRAVKKAESLRAMLSVSNTPYYYVESEKKQQ